MTEDTGYTMSAARRALGADAIEVNRKEIKMNTQPVTTPGVLPGEVRLARTPAATGYTRKGYACPEGKQLYEATGGSGQISVRSSGEPLVAGINVADVAGSTEKQRQGQVWNMFTTVEKANKEAAKLREQGLTVTVVPVRPYAGQDGDPQ